MRKHNLNNSSISRESTKFNEFSMRKENWMEPNDAITFLLKAELKCHPTFVHIAGCRDELHWEHGLFLHTYPYKTHLHAVYYEYPNIIFGYSCAVNQRAT